MTIIPDLEAALELAAEPSESVSASVRLPRNLRDALRLAAEQGRSDNISRIAVSALEAVLADLVQDLALDTHYAARPDTRPALSEEVEALAALVEHPLADAPGEVSSLVARVEAAGLAADVGPADVLRLADLLAAEGGEPAPATVPVPVQQEGEAEEPAVAAAPDGPKAKGKAKGTGKSKGGKSKSGKSKR